MTNTKTIMYISIIICSVNCVFSSIIEYYNKKSYKKNDNSNITTIDHLGKILCLTVCSMIFVALIIFASKIVDCPICPSTESLETSN